MNTGLWMFLLFSAICLAGCSQKQASELGLSAHAMQALRDEGYAEELARAKVVSKLVDSSYTFRVGLGGKLVTVIKNVTNHDFRSGSSDQSTRVVVEEVETILGSWENNHSLLRAKCIEVYDNGDQEQLWSFEEEADAGEKWYPDYRTVENGCCDARPLYRHHRMSDGKNYLTYDLNRVDCSIRSQLGQKNLVNRQIASRCMFPDIDPWPVRDSMALGVIYYASEDSVLHSILVAARDTAVLKFFYWWPYDIQVVSIDSALALVSQFPDSCRLSINSPDSIYEKTESAALLGEFGDGPIIIVPIRNDDFLLERSHLGDFEIIRIN